MTAKKKPTAKRVEFPFYKFDADLDADELGVQKLHEQYFAEGGKPEDLARQLDQALSDNEGVSGIFQSSCLPILREIRDFSQFSTPIVTYAVQNRAYEVLDLLIERGADLYAQAPMLAAASHDDDESAVECAEVLLRAGADPDMTDEHGATALMYAARKGHAAFARRLLAAGADVHRRDQEGLTALHWACCGDVTGGMRSVEIARLLLEAGAHANARDYQRNTPLHMLASFDRSHGQIESCAALDLLLSHGADLEARNAEQHTPVLCAASCFERGGFMLIALHERGADINVKRFGVSDIHQRVEGSPKAKRALASIRTGMKIASVMGESSPAAAPARKAKSCAISPL